MMKNKVEKMLKRVLINQKHIMIWIHGMKTSRPYFRGYFAGDIKLTEEILEEVFDDE